LRIRYISFLTFWDCIGSYLELIKIPVEGCQPGESFWQVIFPGRSPVSSAYQDREIRNLGGQAESSLKKARDAKKCITSGAGIFRIYIKETNRTQSRLRRYS
jgi:hypothetical protein